MTEVTESEVADAAETDNYGIIINNLLIRIVPEGGVYYNDTFINEGTYFACTDTSQLFVSYFDISEYTGFVVEEITTIDEKFLPESIKSTSSANNVATSDVLGSIKADPVESTDTQPVRIGPDGKLYTTSSVSDEHITDLIYNALDTIENGTY